MPVILCNMPHQTDHHANRSLRSPQRCGVRKVDDHLVFTWLQREELERQRRQDFREAERVSAGIK